MMEIVIVIGIVGSAIALIARSIYLTTSGKKSGCTCSGPCPILDKCENKTTLLKINDR